MGHSPAIHSVRQTVRQRNVKYVFTYVDLRITNTMLVLPFFAEEGRRNNPTVYTWSWSSLARNTEQ